MTVNERERKVLVALARNYDSECNCLCFSEIARRSGLAQQQVRRAVRSLARKGLALYERGLFDDEGRVAGSGYSCTLMGKKFLEANP